MKAVSLALDLRANARHERFSSAYDHTEIRSPISSAAPALMVTPEFFSVEYAINPWMERGTPVNVERARKEWACLSRHLDTHVGVQTIDGISGLPDLCFSANAGLLHNGVFVPSNFRYPQRKPEGAFFAGQLAARGFRILDMPAQINFEGAGDALFDRHGVLWMGYGQRSDRRAAAWLESALHISVNALELKDPNFYHLDTCFSTLESGHVVYYPGAFTPEALNTIRSRVPTSYRIEVDRCDAMGFACNMIELPDVVITSYASIRLRSQLASIGKAVLIVQVGEFMKAGGGARCLTLRMPYP